MSNIDDIRFRKVVIGTGVTIALSMATAVQAQTLDELRDRLDPPPETEKEYLDIIAQMDAIELYQRYEFCRQNDLSKADCMDRISLLWDEEDRWRNCSSYPSVSCQTKKAEWKLMTRCSSNATRFIPILSPRPNVVPNSTSTSST